MKRTAFILMASLLLATNLQGQSRGSRRDASRDPLVNVGVKAGFNSSMFFIDHLSVGGQELDDIQNNYKVGYFGAFFCRFNLKSIIIFRQKYLTMYRREVFPLPARPITATFCSIVPW